MNPDSIPPDNWFTTAAVTRMFPISRRTLLRRRKSDQGPPWDWFGGRVMYLGRHLADSEAWDRPFIGPPRPVVNGRQPSRAAIPPGADSGSARPLTRDDLHGLRWSDLTPDGEPGGPEEPDPDDHDPNLDYHDPHPDYPDRPADTDTPDDDIPPWER